MTFTDFTRAVRDRWKIGLTVFLIVLAGFATYAAVRKPEYTANLTMYVSAQVGDNAQAVYQGSLVSEQRVTSYVDLINSPRVTTEVIARTGLQTDPLELSKQITATTKSGSVLITVSVDDTSPTTAAAIANAIGTYFPKLVDDIERPQASPGPPPVAVRVVQPALVPDQPSSPGTTSLLGFGILAALLLGVGVCVSAEKFDTSVRSTSRLQDISETPTLGTVPQDTVLTHSPFAAANRTDASRTLHSKEAFGRIRTNLSYVDIDRPPRTIMVTSSVEGEGKTTLACNMAASLAAGGSPVLLIDCDLRRPRQADYLGLSEGSGITSILSSRATIQEVTQRPAGGNFDFIASGQIPPNPSELLASENMSSLLAHLKAKYEFVIIDVPPLLPVTDAAALAPSVDGVVLVAKCGKVRAGQVKAAIDSLRSVSARLVGCVLNMAPARGHSSYSYHYDPHRRGSQKAGDLVTPIPANRGEIFDRETTRPSPVRRSSS